MEELLRSTAESYGIDPIWIKAIITQESQWNIYAVRFESGYRYLYKPEIFSNHPLISLSTEINTQKTSWGLGQIMGGLAREQGHMGFMAELLEPELNLKHMCIRISHLMKISPLDTDVFAMYNGGTSAFHKISGKYSNQSYVDSVCVNLQKFRK